MTDRQLSDPDDPRSENDRFSDAVKEIAENWNDVRITSGRRFVLIRSKDITGVSGTGVVADGVEFPSGSTVVAWRGEHSSTVIWASIEDAMYVHGHGGATKVHWLD